MKLNTKISINVQWNEEEKVNKTSVDFDSENTLSEILTSIGLVENILKDILYLNCKSEEDIEKVINTKIKNLKNGNI